MAFPQQGAMPPAGYGYPPAQGGYGYPPLANAAEPDWYSLAEENAAKARKRKRMFMIGGGVLAVAAVGGIVFTTLALSDPKQPGPKPTASASGGGDTASPSPSYTGPAPTTPLEVLNSTDTDRAYVTVDSLFPSANLNLNGHLYTKMTTDVDKGCKTAAGNGLESTLASLYCYNVYRATYSYNNLEITIGVATFMNDSRATKAKAATAGNIVPLVKDKVTPFCKTATDCVSWKGALGRYAYFTIAGPADGSAVSAKDNTTWKSAKEISDSMYETLLARGQTGLANWKN